MNVDELARKVSAADPVAGDQVGILRANIESNPDHGPPHGRKAGLVVGKLNEAGLTKGDRYAFSLVTTGVKSSKKWTEADAASILFWLEEGGADHVQRIANAVVRVLYDAALDIGDIEERDSLEAGKRRMDELLEKQQRKESTMGVKVIPLINTVTSGQYAEWGYQGYGDVAVALGLEDGADEFPGTFQEAMTLLEANARGGDVPAQEPEVAPEPPKDENSEVEKEPVDEAFLAQYRAEIDSMPEAPVVAWTKFQRYPGGPTWSLTIRAGLSPECMSFALNETIRGIAAFDKFVHDRGYAAVLDGRDQAAFPVEKVQRKPKAAPAPAQAPQAARTAPPPPTTPQASSGAGGQAPPSAPGGGGDVIETFPVTTIIRDLTSKGDSMYKLQGGKYHKHGVIGYEAVAEAVNALLVAAGVQFDVEQLDLKKPWDVSGYGWIAEAERPAGEQYAKRVIDVKAGS